MYGSGDINDRRVPLASKQLNIMSNGNVAPASNRKPKKLLAQIRFQQPLNSEQISGRQYSEQQGEVTSNHKNDKVLELQQQNSQLYTALQQSKEANHQLKSQYRSLHEKFKEKVCFISDICLFTALSGWPKHVPIVYNVILTHVKFGIRINK